MTSPTCYQPTLALDGLGNGLPNVEEQERKRQGVSAICLTGMSTGNIDALGRPICQILDIEKRGEQLHRDIRPGGVSDDQCLAGRKVGGGCCVRQGVKGQLEDGKTVGVRFDVAGRCKGNDGVLESALDDGAEDGILSPERRKSTPRPNTTRNSAHSDSQATHNWVTRGTVLLDVLERGRDGGGSIGSGQSLGGGSLVVGKDALGGASSLL